MLNNKIKAVSLALVLILCLTMLTGCFDPYAKYRYPTAKEAMEAEGYEVKKVYGEVELNGLICYSFSKTDIGGGFIYAILTKNKNGYCVIDPHQKEDYLSAMYNNGTIRHMVATEKFSKYIIYLNLFYEGEKPEIVDSLGNEAVIIETGYGWSEAFLILNRMSKDYKVCVDGIWYPMPKTSSDWYADPLCRIK